MGIILYEFDDLTVARERRLGITDCIFRNFDGGVFSISEGPFQARALNIVGFTRADPNESLDIQIVRSGFFDNESGGVLLLVLNVDDGSTGNVNANVRDFFCCRCRCCYSLVPSTAVYVRCTVSCVGRREAGMIMRAWVSLCNEFALP